MNDIEMLMAYGVSPAGAEQSTLGQPVTNPADRVVIENLKRVAQSPTSVSDAAMVKQRLVPHTSQSMQRATLKHRADVMRCDELLEYFVQQNQRVRYLASSLAGAKFRLSILERSPAKPGDARYKYWKAERDRVNTEVTSINNELQTAKFTENGMRNKYNITCGGTIPPTVVY